MALSLDDLTRKIDAANLERVEMAAEKARHVGQIRRELMRIYREHQPSKIEEVDSMLEKYADKEEDLLLAVKKKYCVTFVQAQNWMYVLKNYSCPWEGDKKSRQRQTWEVEKSLANVRKELDEMARSIKGECKIVLGAQGCHKLVVRRRSNTEPLCSLSLVEATVDKMRMRLVRKRYSHKAKASNFSEEHIQRQVQKEIDQKLDACRTRRRTAG